MHLPGFERPISDYLDIYLRAFPEERTRLESFQRLLDLKGVEDDLFDRSKFLGHITASAIVLSRDRKSILLQRHRYIRDRLLQPGGHVDDADQTVLAAAQRELREETGISNARYLPYHSNHLVPIDIDTHDIPENHEKSEPMHVHHDFRYLFILEGDFKQTQERMRTDGELVWKSFDEVSIIHTFKVLVEKIRVCLSNEFQPRRFYQKVGELAAIDSQISVVAVSHILPDSKSYIDALNSNFILKGIIPKPKSIVVPILHTIEKESPILQFDRNDINSGKGFIEFISKIKEQFILFDIGGYFAPNIHNIFQATSDRLLGVIEDTENGHQKYIAADEKRPLPTPVISVARSPLKDNEDYLVGQSVLFSADAILRQCGLLIQYLKCGVLGYGKIGSSIARHLAMRGVKPHVFDINSIRRIHANNHLCLTPSREEIVKTSDVIFSATGKQALSTLDFRDLKPGCFVFSVTSSDDEFDTRFLEGDFKRSEAAEYVDRYERSNGQYFYLVNEGNAVNFLHKAVLGAFIHLVRSEMIFAASYLVAGKCPAGINEISTDDRRKICEAWLSTFNNTTWPANRIEIKDVLT